jgi:hypothetical protein
MDKKTKSIVTLSAVVTSLGTALGVASTDLQAATATTQFRGFPHTVQHKFGPDATQFKFAPEVTQHKLGPDATQLKFRPEVTQGKDFRPDALQIKLRPDAIQIKELPSAVQMKMN